MGEGDVGKVMGGEYKENEVGISDPREGGEVRGADDWGGGGGGEVQTRGVRWGRKVKLTL